MEDPQRNRAPYEGKSGIQTQRRREFSVFRNEAEEGRCNRDSHLKQQYFIQVKLEQACLEVICTREMVEHTGQKVGFCAKTGMFSILTLKHTGYETPVPQTPIPHPQRKRLKWQNLISEDLPQTPITSSSLQHQERCLERQSTMERSSESLETDPA